jgi:hypothetical protein
LQRTTGFGGVTCGTPGGIFVSGAITPICRAFALSLSRWAYCEAEVGAQEERMAGVVWLAVRRYETIIHRVTMFAIFSAMRLLVCVCLHWYSRYGRITYAERRVFPAITETVFTDFHDNCPIVALHHKEVVVLTYAWKVRVLLAKSASPCKYSLSRLYVACCSQIDFK